MRSRRCPEGQGFVLDEKGYQLRGGVCVSGGCPETRKSREGWSSRHPTSVPTPPTPWTGDPECPDVSFTRRKDRRSGPIHDILSVFRTQYLRLLVVTTEEYHTPSRSFPYLRRRVLVFGTVKRRFIGE